MLRRETKRIRGAEVERADQPVIALERQDGDAPEAARAREQQLVISAHVGAQPGPHQRLHLRRQRHDAVCEQHALEGIGLPAVAQQQVANLVLRVLQYERGRLEPVGAAQAADHNVQ